jgi:hypothetical protein
MKTMSKLETLDRHSRYVDGTFFCQDDGSYTLENLWDEEHLGVVTAKDSEINPQDSGVTLLSRSKLFLTERYCYTTGF